MSYPYTGLGSKVIQLKEDREQKTGRRIQLQDIALALNLDRRTFSLILHDCPQHKRPTYQFIVEITCIFNGNSAILREFESLLLSEWGGHLQIDLATLRAVDKLMEDMTIISSRPDIERIDMINAKLQEIFPSSEGIGYQL